MKTLQHNQEIRVNGFSALAQKITVGTSRGYAAQYNEDPEEAHNRTLRNGHQTAWANQEASALTSDYPGKHEALDAAAKATAEALEIRDGELVLIEGEIFRVKVLGERYADPVHFFRHQATKPLAVNGYALILEHNKAGRITNKYRGDQGTTWGIAYDSEYTSRQLLRLSPEEYHALPEENKIVSYETGVPLSR
jgi:hypothetical protein